MTNTQLYYSLVKQFMLAFDQRCFRFTSDVPTKTLILRATLIDEEHDEYCAATKANNKIEILDALCDLAYVTAGTLATCGLMPIPYSSKGSYTGITLEHKVDNVIDECHLGVPCHKRMYRYVNDLLIVIDNIGHEYRLPEAFKVVHENNMAKLWIERPNDASLVAIPKGKKWLVLRKADGKVMKPLNHTKPDLSRFI